MSSNFSNSFLIISYLIITIDLIFSVTIIQSDETPWITYASSPITVTTDNDATDFSWIYEGCQNNEKVCFGFPAGCVDQKNCNAFGAVIFDENQDFIFEQLSMGKINSKPKSSSKILIIFF